MPVQHAGLPPVHRARCSSSATTVPEIIEEMMVGAPLRAHHPPDRPRPGQLDGAEEARGVFLRVDAIVTVMNSQDGLLTIHD